jgi:hypothetical protein
MPGDYQAAEKRTIGFGISFVSGIVLLLGSLIGVILSGKLIKLIVTAQASSLLDLKDTFSERISFTTRNLQRLDFRCWNEYQ